MQISYGPRLVGFRSGSGKEIAARLKAYLALLVIWQAQLVQCDFILKRVGQSRVASPLRCWKCLPGSFFCLRETAALSASSRKGAQIIRIFAARKPHGLFSGLDCSIPIANRSIQGDREETSPQTIRIKSLQMVFRGVLV